MSLLSEAVSDIDLQKQGAAWVLRLFFALLLLAGSDLLLWFDLAVRSPGEWVLTGIGTLALAALALDLSVRYRIRDIYDAMAVTTIYALLYGLLIVPELSYTNFPVTLVTRVLGAQALTALISFGVFAVLLHGTIPRYRRLIIPAALWLGFYRGVWLRWGAELRDYFAPVSLEMMLLSIIPYVIVSLLCFLLVQRTSRTQTASMLKFSLIEGLLLILVLLIIFMIRVAQGDIPSVAVVATLIIISVCIGILYFRHEPENRMVMNAYVPPTPLSWGWIGLMLVVFIGMSVIAYNLPLFGTGEIHQFWLMELGFSVVGFAWMPLIGTVVAFRGVDRQMRQGDWNI
ncbi:MAG: hypothetical protein ACPG7F_09205 [Aggregatilineales bacterium]